MDLDRILQGTQAQIGTTFELDGDPIDPSPDACQVRVVRADGTELAAVGPADEAGQGAFAKTLSPSQTAQLDLVTAEWTATVDGAAQTTRTHHEITGGFLFSIASAKLRPALADLDDDELYTGRVLAEQSLEDECGVAFVPRYALRSFDGHGRCLLRPPHRRLRAVRSVTIDGTAYTPEQLAEIKITAGGSLYNPAGWPCGHGNIVVGYEHGHDFPPARVGNAALLLLERWRVAQSTGERVVSASVDRVSFRLAVAGKEGQNFDVPEANAIVNAHGNRATRLA